MRQETIAKASLDWLQCDIQRATVEPFWRPLELAKSSEKHVTTGCRRFQPMGQLPVYAKAVARDPKRMCPVGLREPRPVNPAKVEHAQVS